LALLPGPGWDPVVVSGPEPDVVHRLLADAVDDALDEIDGIHARARADGSAAHPRWPMIVLRSPKGWTGPKEVDGLPTEGTWRSHQVPLADIATKPDHLRQLEAWLRSYRPDELFDANGRLKPELAALSPEGDRRMGTNRNANGGLLLKDLRLPAFREYALDVTRPGNSVAEATRVLGMFLRDTIKLTAERRNFRIVAPDELTSNRLGAVLEVTGRAWMAERVPGDDHLDPSG